MKGIATTSSEFALLAERSRIAANTWRLWANTPHPHTDLSPIGHALADVFATLARLATAASAENVGTPIPAMLAYAEFPQLGDTSSSPRLTVREV